MGLLRLILAITVVIAHSNAVMGLRLTGGLVAVEMFFIISGFYMTMILDKKYIGKGSYALFLSNRFLRLYPIFWAVLLLTIIYSIVGYIFSGEGFVLSSYIKYYDVMKIETLVFQIFSNVALLGQDIVMFLGFNQETGGMYFTHNFRTSSQMFYKFLFVPQAWTLSLEILFYLIAPFLVRKRTLVIISIIIMSLFIRALTYSMGYTNDPWTYRFFPSELALFLLGTISYRLYDVYKIHQTKIYNFNLTGIVLASTFSIIFFYQYMDISGYTRHIFNWFFYGFFCLSIPFIFDFSKSSKIDSRIGELSYPVYISHILVIMLISPLLSLTRLTDYSGELAVISTILVSYILVILISDPIEKIRQARVKAVKIA